ncbi:RHS repeat-associated core domain-containing protein [bacterium]|nr:RHS repeat-associated core domain-containing protein [bacterium]
MTDTYAYTAFGDLYAQTGTTPNRYLYTGQQFDALTGQYSLRARFYAPGAGRFLSRDVYPVNFRNPIELNRYGYVAGNPMNAWDPSGLFAGVERSVTHTIPIPSIGGLKAVGGIILGAKVKVFVVMSLLQGMLIAPILAVLADATPHSSRNEDDDNEATKPVYRLGNTNARNLTPRPDKDVPGGLSMTTTRPNGKAWMFPGGKKQLQALGFVVQDPPSFSDSGHVLVSPGPGPDCSRMYSTGLGKYP